MYICPCHSLTSSQLLPGLYIHLFIMPNISVFGFTVPPAWSGGPSVIPFRLRCHLTREDFTNQPPLKHHLIALQPLTRLYFSSWQASLLSHYIQNCLFLSLAPCQSHENREVSALAAESPAPGCGRHLVGAGQVTETLFPALPPQAHLPVTQM